MLRISQQSNWRLRVLAGQIKNDDYKYSETLKLPSTDLDKLIKSRFNHALQIMRLEIFLVESNWDDRGSNGSEDKTKSHWGQQTTVLKQASCWYSLKGFRSRLIAYILGRTVSPCTIGKAIFAGMLARICTRDNIGAGFTYRPKHMSQANQKVKKKQIQTLWSDKARAARGIFPGRSPASSCRKNIWFVFKLFGHSDRLSFSSIASLQWWTWRSSYEPKGVSTG